MNDGEGRNGIIIVARETGEQQDLYKNRFIYNNMDLGPRLGFSCL